MKSSMKHALLPLAISAAIASPMSAYATNGMNMEGYGPIATGMGGASMAYDNGTAAMMNNPATLGLMAEDSSRLDLAVGRLGIDITSTFDPTGSGTAPMTGPMPADSDATAFYMPAFGYVQRNGELSYGLGVFAQGGMGAEYAGNTFMGAGSGGKTRSEVGVGRAIVPVAMNVSDELTLAGSLDFVWASMDLKMAMPGSQFATFVPALSGSEAMGTASGSMVDGMVGMITAANMDPSGPINFARFDFSNSNEFSGQAIGYGFAGKLGVVYKVSDTVTVGATYHTKTKLGDMKTDNADVSMSANIDDNMLGMTWDGTPPTAPGYDAMVNGVPAVTYSAATIGVRGKIAVKDFQWPATFGAGIAIQATDDLMVAADVKRIQWSDVMADFNMSFVADATQSGLAAGFAGATMDVNMIQNWDDQTVYEIGVAYKMSDALTLRAGFNGADNPVPDTYLNALFPATINDHYTVGAGLALNDSSDINFSLAFTPEAKNTNPGLSGAPIAGDEITITHKQINWQLMYSASF